MNTMYSEDGTWHGSENKRHTNVYSQRHDSDTTLYEKMLHLHFCVKFT